MAGRSNLDRVHFYSEHDMATPYEVDKIINRLRSINPYGDITDLNDVMELWNIHQYSKRNLLPINLKEVEEKYLKDIISKLQGIIIQLISQWPKENFEDEYGKLSYDYQHNFWKVIVETNTYKLFPKSVLMKCIQDSCEYADKFYDNARVAVESILLHEPFKSRADDFNFVAVAAPSVDSGVSVPHHLGHMDCYRR